VSVNEEMRRPWGCRLCGYDAGDGTSDVSVHRKYSGLYSAGCRTAPGDVMTGVTVVRDTEPEQMHALLCKWRLQGYAVPKHVLATLREELAL